MSFLSPLRYPGGKRQLANFVKLVIRKNRMLDGTYIEPYAGGASIGLALLYEEYVRRIHINDFDRAIYAFWYATLERTDELCRLVERTPVDIATWRRQRAVQEAKDDADLLTLGFSTLFLNRVNRSGIITGGVIGGLRQTGRWKLDARFIPATITTRLRRIATYRDRILLTRMDAIDLLDAQPTARSPRTLLYLDPPYYVKGRSNLYANYYGAWDHARIAEWAKSTDQHWMISYDDVPEVVKLYRGCRRVRYGLNYSAAVRERGREVMFLSAALERPKVRSVIGIPDKAVLALAS